MHIKNWHTIRLTRSTKNSLVTLQYHYGLVTSTRSMERTVVLELFTPEVWWKINNNYNNIADGSSKNPSSVRRFNTNALFVRSKTTCCNTCRYDIVFGTMIYSRFCFIYNILPLISGGLFESAELQTECGTTQLYSTIKY